MQMSSEIYDKRQRGLIYGAISRQSPGGVPIADYSLKVHRMLKEWGIVIQISTIRQILWWGSNNQPVFRAAYKLLKEERPEVAKELFNGIENKEENLQEA